MHVSISPDHILTFIEEKRLKSFAKLEMERVYVRWLETVLAVPNSPREAWVPVPGKNPGEEPVPQVLADQGDDLDKALQH